MDDWHAAAQSPVRKRLQPLAPDGWLYIKSKNHLIRHFTPAHHSTPNSTKPLLVADFERPNQIRLLSTLQTLSPPSDHPNMHVTQVARWVMAALLGGKASALHAQYPFLSSELEGAVSAFTIVPLHGRADRGLLPPYMENGAILSRQSLLSLPDSEFQIDVEVVSARIASL